MWSSCSLGHAHWGRWGAAGLLLAREGRVLLQLRARWVHQGGTWSIPGGALERGETALEAALREAHEELRIDAAAVVPGGSWVSECGGWTYETVLAEVAPGVDLDLRDDAESEAHAWVPVAEVPDRPLHPGFARAWSAPDDVVRGFVAGTG